ncbi:MAG: AAA family ATPase [Desulfocucumaceae bacterium]
MIKEISIGFGMAAFIFLAVAGYDIFPLIFLAAAGTVLYFIARSRGMVTKNFGGSGAPPKHDVTFEDVGGQASAINELKEALEFIKNHSDIQKLGIRPLKGILLTGPPGTGKTLLAKAAAGYTDASFVSAAGSEFIEMYAGVGAQRVRKLFQNSRESSLRVGKNNSIIFIDEIEILGGKRGQTTSHLEYDQTLNELLVQMDGLKVDDRVRVLLIAATNRVDMLDPALLRPGRFDRQVKVDLPDREGRLEILKIHTRNKPLAGDVNLDSLARETFGFSGAHLESLTNEAAILAMREKLEQVHRRHFHEAVDKVMMGERLDRQPIPAELKRVAIHETGHAFLSEYMRRGSVSTLTITPRGQALGYMRQTPEDDTYLYTREHLENQIAVMLAGAVAEEMILGGRSTGAGNDYLQATRTADQIINSGMSDLGVIDPDMLPRSFRYRSQKKILQAQEDRVRVFLEEKREELSRVVDLLLEQEKISGQQLRKVLGQQPECA